MFKVLNIFFYAMVMISAMPKFGLAESGGWQTLKFQKVHLSELQMKGLMVEPSGLYAPSDLKQYDFDPLPIVYYTNDIQTSRGIFRFAIIDAACGMQNCYLDYSLKKNNKVIKSDQGIFICQAFDMIEVNLKTFEVRSCGGRAEKLVLN